MICPTKLRTDATQNTLRELRPRLERNSASHGNCGANSRYVVEKTAISARNCNKRMGVKKLFPLRNSNLGSGSAVGSGNQFHTTMNAVTSTMGSAAILRAPMWRRTMAPTTMSGERQQTNTNIQRQWEG